MSEARDEYSGNQNRKNSRKQEQNKDREAEPNSVGQEQAEAMW